ncbi:GNAT family N-acetyltransferase [Nocardioides marinquilinus]|uniref:GNAT family N-acetyltransferase n=1 Tax=Nocardioides marinquilinus TaxID=1210400 RepID=A0ABP9PPT6_9ACTN
MSGAGHGLGPHVVGTRVVVRRVVRGERGPSGGPALTDVLGVCEAWDDVAGVCLVRREDGGLERIAIADVVTGKPVPPRASVRARVSPREAQLRGAALFPTQTSTPLGDWVLRACPDVTARRANSVLAFGPPGVDDAPARAVAHYARGRAVAAVLPGSPEEQALVSAGWVGEPDAPDTLFQVASAAQVSRALRGADDAAVDLEPDGDLAVATVGDRASGVAGYGDDWVGFRAIEVHPDHRRRGLALAVMAALLDWAAARGASTVYLQVHATNAPALALYERLGFRTHHAYRYVTAPESPTAPNRSDGRSVE